MATNKLRFKPVKQASQPTVAFTWPIDSTHTPNNLTGFTITGTMYEVSNAGDVTAISGAFAVVDGAARTCTWAMSALDTGTHGIFKVTLYATDGTDNIYSLYGDLEIEENPSVTAVQNDALVGISTAKDAWLTAFLAAAPDGVIDEDDMSSDSDTAVPTQQSVRAYVDTSSVAKTGDTMTGALVIDNSGAEALIVRKASDGGDVFKVDTTNGLVSIGAIASPVEIFEVRGEPDYTTDAFGIRSTLTANHPTGDASLHWSAMLAQTIQSGVVQNGAWLSAMYTYYRQDGAGTQADVRSIAALNRINDGVATAVHGVYSDIQVTGDAIAGDVYHFRASPTVLADTGQISGTEYGLYVGNLTSGTTNNYGVFVHSNVKSSFGAVSVFGDLAIGAGKRLLMDDGTISLPSVTFDNDENCGMYRIGTDNIGFAAGGQNTLEYNAGTVGIGTERAGITMAAKLDVYQWQAGGAIPVLRLSQLDVSEEIVEIDSVAGVGNAIELVGAKSLTVTEFIKVTINGNTRYIAAGTIA